MSSIFQDGLYEVEGILYLSAELDDSVVLWKGAILKKPEHRKSKKQLGDFVTCQLAESDHNRQTDFSCYIHILLLLF